MKVHYVNTSRLNDFLAIHQGKVMAQINYGIPSHSGPCNEALSISVNVPSVLDSTLVEVWTANSPVFQLPEVHENDHAITVAYDEQTMAGCIQVLESAYMSLEEAVHLAYRQVLECTNRHGYPNLIRIWNYLPRINEIQDGLERYQRFCVGRHQVFSGRSEAFHSYLPAASAVGTNSGQLQICFIAQKTRGRHFENPRQMSAYHYPSVYGPKSPSFARATLSQQNERALFLAGTASIVGHATQHLWNLREQTLETLKNLDSLVDHVQKALADVEPARFTFQVLKVYIRPGQEALIVKEVIERYVGMDVPTLYLAAELCRKDLLVEIESILERRL